MQIRRHPALRALWAACGLLAIARCSPTVFVDDDADCSKAKPLPSSVLKQDELNVRMGDVSDCHLIKYFKDATAKVEVRFGSAFEKHNLKGLVTVYDSDAQVLDQKALDPTIFRYDFEFEVRANKPFYLEAKATEGAHGYTAQVSFVAADPCARCTDEQECVEGKCRAKKKVCDPACDEDIGEVCEEGECVSVCKPECKPGTVCNPESRECEKVAHDCNPKCKGDTYCDTRAGVCRQKKVGCGAGCPAGQVCQANKCVTIGGAPKCPKCAKDEKCDTGTGKCIAVDAPITTTGKAPVAGTIVSVARSGDATTLYLNRGTSQGITPGSGGTACGKFPFVVLRVFPMRSQARAKANVDEIGSCTSVVIRPK